MKTSSGIFIWIGLMLLTEFVGGVVYRALQSDNSQKEDRGSEGNANADEAEDPNGLIIEESSVVDKNEIQEQGGIGQDVSDKIDEIDTSGLKNTRGGGAVCTCVEQEVIYDEDGQAGSEQDNQIENGGTENTGEESNIEAAKENSEMDGTTAAGEAEDVETMNSTSDDRQEAELEENTDGKEENGDQDDMDTYGKNGFYEGIPTFTFSSLDS